MATSPALLKAHTVIFIGLLYTVISSQLQEGDDCGYGYYKNENSTCESCAPCQAGYEIVQCSNQSDTSCKSCDPGTFSSGRFKCKACSHCPPGTHVARYCDVTRDTQCDMCEEGYYASQRSARRCTRCSTCNRFMPAERNCSRTQNTKCGDCIQGYYKHPHVEVCIRCSFCYPDHPNSTKVIKACIEKSDDPLMRCDPLSLPLGFAGENGDIMTMPSTTSTVKLDQMTRSEADVLIPIQFSVPIIIVCFSLSLLVVTAFVLYKCRKVRCLNQRESKCCTICVCVETPCFVSKKTMKARRQNEKTRDGERIVFSMNSGNKRDGTLGEPFHDICETMIDGNVTEDSKLPQGPKAGSSNRDNGTFLSIIIRIFKPKPEHKQKQVRLTELIERLFSRFLKSHNKPKQIKKMKNIEVAKVEETVWTCADNEAFRSDDEAGASSGLLQETLPRKEREHLNTKTPLRKAANIYQQNDCVESDELSEVEVIPSDRSETKMATTIAEVTPLTNLLADDSDRSYPISVVSADEYNKRETGTPISINSDEEGNGEMEITTASVMSSETDHTMVIHDVGADQFESNTILDRRKDNIVK